MLEIPDYPISNSILPYCLLGLAAMVEGPITLLAGGAATAVGLLLPLPAYLSVVTGNLTADMGWYGLGRVCAKVGIDSRCIEQLKENV